MEDHCANNPAGVGACDEQAGGDGTAMAIFQVQERGPA
jgi:hypothetical protein